MLKKSITTAALLSTLLSSMPSQAYFGQSMVDGAYDTASKAATWVKENPGKTALGGIAIFGVAIYGAYLDGVAHQAQSRFDEAKRSEADKMERKIQQMADEIQKNVRQDTVMIECKKNNAESNDVALCLLQKKQKSGFQSYLAELNITKLDLSSKKNVDYISLASYLDGTKVTKLDLSNRPQVNDNIIDELNHIPLISYGLSDLLALPQLEEINLSNSNINGAHLSRFFVNNLKPISLKVKHLNLSNNQINFGLSGVFADMFLQEDCLLNTLDLSGNKFNEQSIASLAASFHLSKMSELKLGGHDVSESFVESLSKNFGQNFDSKTFVFTKVPATSATPAA